MATKEQQIEEIIKKYSNVKLDLQEDTQTLLSLSRSEQDSSFSLESSLVQQQQNNSPPKQLTPAENLSLIKNQVLDLLLNYQKALSAGTEDFRSLKSKLNSDACKVNEQYKLILQTSGFTCNNDTKLIMQVIEEFVLKFSGLNEKEIMRYQQPATTKKQLFNEISTFLQISNISNINFNQQEDTFYRVNTKEQIEIRLNSKIERLKIRLEKALGKSHLENTRRILKESIEDLNNIVAQNNITDIKKIVYKLEQSIKSISENEQLIVSGEQTVSLYQLLQKAIKFTKKKDILSKQNKNTQIPKPVIGKAQQIKQQITQPTQIVSQITNQQPILQNGIQQFQMSQKMVSSPTTTIQQNNKDQFSVSMKNYSTFQMSTQQQVTINQNSQSSKQNLTQQTSSNGTTKIIQLIPMKNYQFDQPVPQNAFQKKKNPDENAGLSKNIHLISQIKEVPYLEPLGEKTNTSIQQNPLSPKNENNQTEFLHLCLKIKSQLPADHPGKRLLIFQLFDQVMQQGVQKEQWSNWIGQQMQKIK